LIEQLQLNVKAGDDSAGLIDFVERSQVAAKQKVAAGGAGNFLH